MSRFRISMGYHIVIAEIVINRITKSLARITLFINS